MERAFRWFPWIEKLTIHDWRFTLTESKLIVQHKHRQQIPWRIHKVISRESVRGLPIVISIYDGQNKAQVERKRQGYKRTDVFLDLITVSTLHSVLGDSEDSYIYLSIMQFV